LKTPINENNFYYNELATKITDDIFENLNYGIKWDQTQYDWMYDISIDKEENLRYMNFTYSVDRIPKHEFTRNDIIGSSGLDEICIPHIKIHMLMEARKWIKSKYFDYAQVLGVIAHELHHLAQDFDLIEYEMPDTLIGYFLNPIEIEAFHIGFRAESAQSGKTIEDCIRKYLNNFLNDNRITKKEYEKILVKWTKPEIKLLKGVNNEN
jgi:hypothetical protein